MNFGEQIEEVERLMENKQYEEAKIVLGQIDKDKISASELGTVYTYLGTLADREGDKEAAVDYFDKALCQPLHMSLKLHLQFYVNEYGER